MDGYKFTFMPSANESTHVGFNDPHLLVDAVMEHLHKIYEESPRGINMNVSMRDCEFGPDENALWTGVCIMYHDNIDDEVAVRKGGIPVAFITGMNTLEFIKACPVAPDAWCKGDEPMQKYERPQGRLH
jgi:hypothetical protein